MNKGRILVNRFLLALTLFLSGGVAYCALEMIFRGFTHWSMGVAGGMSLAVMYFVFEGIEGEAVWNQWISGALIITCIELLTGIIVNLIFRLNVWDYSDMPLNYLGQICPLFTLLWFVICIPVSLLCGFIRSRYRRVIQYMPQAR